MATNLPALISTLIVVGVHNLSCAAPVYHHSFHILAPDSEGDQQRIIMGLDGSDLIFL